MQYLANPLTGLEVSAFMQMALSLAFFSVSIRRREPGVIWLALGFGVLALTVFLPYDAAQSNGQVLFSRQWVLAALLGMMMAVLGLVGHLRLKSVPGVGVSLWTFLGIVSATLIYLAPSWPQTRLSVNVTISVMVLVLGFLCMWAAQRERLLGLWAAGVSLLGFVAVQWFCYLHNTRPVISGTLLSLPSLLLGFALLLSTLQRRERTLESEVALRIGAEEKLRSLNALLEDRVSQRTADLQRMVSGLESFNRSVSHDLRGPLGSMATLARMAYDALSGGDVELGKKVLPNMARQADAMHRMVDALLELARVSDWQLKKEPVDLQDVVQDVVSDLTLVNPGLPIADVVVIKPMFHVMSDRDLLLPVFMNLIGNALKFAKPDAPPRMEIGVMPPTGNELTVYVRDDGRGFDDTRADELFKPFTRMHGQVIEGHGVGLSIVHRAVERLGGRVWARSAPGEGACFYFTLPIA